MAAKRPKTFAVGRVKVMAVRGPRAGTTDTWYWRARLHRDGRYETLWTGWATVGEAEVEVARLVAGGRERAVEAGDERVETVRDLLEVWAAQVEDRADLAANSKRNYLKSARHLVQHIGDVRLDRLDVRVLAVYRDTALKAGYSSAVVFEDLKLLRPAHRWGQALGLVADQRPLGSVRLRRRPAREKVTPTVQEFWRVVDALPQPWQRTMAISMEATGCRMGEAAGLLWDDVDLTNKMVTLREGKTPRDCLIPDGLVEHLTELRPCSGGRRVLPVTQGTAVSNFGQALRDLPWEELGIRRFTSHGIRRMSVDRMYTSGADVGAVAAQLGQSPQVALHYYRQASHEDRRKAIALAGMGE